MKHIHLFFRKEPRAGISLALIAVLVAVGVFVPNPTGEPRNAWQTSLLTTDVPIEQLTTKNGFSREEIIQRFLYAKESTAIDWVAKNKEILEITPLTADNITVAQPTLLSFSPFKNTSTFVGKTNASRPEPLKDIDLFVKTLRGVGIFSDVTISEVQKMPSSSSPAPLRFSLALTDAYATPMPFAPSPVSELTNIQYLRAFPDNPNQGPLLQDFYDMATDNTIQLTALEFLEDQTTSGAIITMPFKITVQGRLADIFNVISDTATHPRKLTVNLADITIDESSGGMAFGKAQLLMEAYWYKEG